MLDRDDVEFFKFMLVTMLDSIVSVACKEIEEAGRAQRRRRRFQRPALGVYLKHFKELRQCPAKFYNWTRMSMLQFDTLLGLIQPHLEKRDAYFHRPIPNEIRLLITLRFLAAGDSVQTLSEFYRIGVSTAHTIIKEVVAAIWDGLSPTYVKVPSTEEEYKKIADGFESRWNLPHCVGAFDGKQIKCKSAPRFSSYPQKQFFSLILFAVCDADYCFTMVDIGDEGDKFQESDLGRAMSKSQFPLPKPKPLPNSTKEFPYYFIGDEALAMRENSILIPFGDKWVSGGTEQAINNKIYNYRLSRAQKVTENAFGIMSSRWRIFHTTINCEASTARSIVQTCVALHNFVMKTQDKLSKNAPAGYYGDIYAEVASDEPAIRGLWRSQREIFEKCQIFSDHDNDDYPDEPRKLRDILTEFVNVCLPLKDQRELVLKIGEMIVDENE